MLDGVRQGELRDNEKRKEQQRGKDKGGAVKGGGENREVEKKTCCQASGNSDSWRPFVLITAEQRFVAINQSVCVCVYVCVMVRMRGWGGVGVGGCCGDILCVCVCVSELHCDQWPLQLK